MLRTALAAALLSGALAATSLAQNSVEGNWSLSGINVPKGVRASASLRAATIRFTLVGPQGGKTVTMAATGSYTLRKNVLTLTFRDAAISSPQFTPAERAKIGSPAMRARLRQGVSQQNTSGTVAFQGKDRFVLTEKSGKRTVFTRAR